MVRFHARHLVPAALLASCLVAARADDPPPADAPAPAAAEAAAARRVIAEAITIHLGDNRCAWLMDQDGNYHASPLRGRRRQYSSQSELQRRLSR